MPGLAQESGQSPVQEHFVRQEASENLLIRVNPFEAEFSSRVTAPDGSLWIESGLQYSTLAPIFQYVPQAGHSRQLDIDIFSARHSNRMRFELALTRVSVTDDRSDRLAQAYQALSFGLQKDETRLASGWIVKIGSLLNASGVFDDYGMQELRLWSIYLAAHLIHYQLRDDNSALGFLDQVLSLVEHSLFKQIELASLKLKSSVFLSLKAAGKLNASAANPDPVQSTLAQLISLADSMDFQYERAWALHHSAIDYVQRQMYRRALARFQSARELADALAAEVLARESRENIVEIYATQGDVLASAEILKEIETQLSGEGAGNDLALNLLQQGRLYVANYRHPEAVGVLLQALQHQNNNITRAQINISLAKAYFEHGLFDAALDILQNSLIDLDSGEVERPSVAIDMVEPLRIMANIYRYREQFSSMRQARDLQAGFLRSDRQKAAFWFEKGLDSQADKSRAQQSQIYFRRSIGLAAQGKDLSLQHLSQLNICATATSDGEDMPDCGRENVHRSFESAISIGIPKTAVGGRYLYAQYLDRMGNKAKALSQLRLLLDDIHFYRQVLPGVLGDWYWQHHQSLFANTMRRVIAEPGDGMRSLLTLSKLRHIRHASEAEFRSTANSSDSSIEDGVRVLLARHEQSSGTDALSMQDRIEADLLALRKSFREISAPLSEQGLRDFLQRLDEDQAILTFYFMPGSAYAWLGHSGRIEKLQLPRQRELGHLMGEAQDRLLLHGKSGIDALAEKLGELLLRPLVGKLPNKILWVSPAQLMGVPFDALRIDGSYLAEKHQVTNLLSFPTGSPVEPILPEGFPHSVFLSGHPLDFSGEFSMRVETSAEIRSVAGFFIGPGLHIVQGSGLIPEAFASDRFLAAELVHLSMPALIDLNSPFESGLELSEVRRGGGRLSIDSQALAAREISAKLVFLSAGTIRKNTEYRYAHQPELPSAFLRAGAGSVIASLWASKAPGSDKFVADFYRNLGNTGDVASALVITKRQHILTDRQLNSHDWARFQLFSF